VTFRIIISNRVGATIKSWMGATYFQMKTLKNVSTEMALHVLAYTMKRVMRILASRTNGSDPNIRSTFGGTWSRRPTLNIRVFTQAGPEADILCALIGVVGAID
jgi:hypothetical protein